MKINLKKACGILFVMMLMCGFLNGCNNKLTTSRLMKAVAGNLREVSSMRNHLKLDIEVEDVLTTTKVNMNIQMENQTEPKAGHAKGTANVSIRDVAVSSDIEIYQVMEDGQLVTYSSTGGGWLREVPAAGSSELLVNGDFFDSADRVLKSFAIAKESVTVNEQECYEIYGDILGSDLKKLLGQDILMAFNLVNIPDEDAVLDLKIPLIIDIYSEQKLPARLIVDMSYVMNELYKKYDKTTKVNVFKIELLFDSFDDVGQIVVPPEVLL